MDRSQYTKLISLRVRHDDPRYVSLADVNSDRPEALQAPNLDFLIVWAKVQVESVLSSLLITAGHQCQGNAWRAVRLQQVAA